MDELAQEIWDEYKSYLHIKTGNKFTSELDIAATKKHCESAINRVISALSVARTPEVGMLIVAYKKARKQIQQHHESDK